MLDFSKLKTPANHGEVLVVPQAAALVKAARANNQSLGEADVSLAGSTLAAWRRRTRQAIVGCDDALVIVTGHQPAFIHPGVWAKHIVAARLAAAVDGVALNLVVDSDAPRSTLLPVPSVTGSGVALRSVRFARLPTGHAFEQIGRQTSHEAGEFQTALRETMGERYDASQMPTFFKGFTGASEARDWVDQAVAGRRAVEANFGVKIDERRLSSLWCSPLLIDMLTEANRFAACYNNALEWYRREYRVRGLQRPIPDLHLGDERCEAAVWAYRGDGPRRRLFVSRAGDKLQLFAEETRIGVVPLRRLGSFEELESAFSGLSGWRLRPRALTLTIWARLLLADLFIHGIGGAKYDRIADAIMADYYGVTAPGMACVSATLHMDLPHTAATSDTVRRLRHALRDLQFNPQRNVPTGTDVQALIERRAETVRRAVNLRESDRGNHRARFAAFSEIRDLSTAILGKRQDSVSTRRSELAHAVQDLQRNRIARGREYFFGLYDRLRLERLLQALPARRDFRV